MPNLVDRKYVSRYGQPGFGIRVYRNGQPGDADAPPSVSLIRDGETVPAWTGSATRDEIGVYSVRLSSMLTSEEGYATLRWDYEIGGEPQIYALDIEIGPSAPDYDVLSPQWQDLVEQVWIKFADAFDSPYGGPNLQVYMQTRFGRNRIAQLLPDALQRLNAASSPHVVYAMNGTDFPFAEWGPLLSDVLYVETIKHLVRSYLEQPEVVLGTAVSRLDRRDYFNRWQEVLQIEDRDIQADLKRYRMANMGLGNVNVLVSGGAYGNIGYYEPPGGLGAAAARGYFYFARWH